MRLPLCLLATFAAVVRTAPSVHLFTDSRTVSHGGGWAPGAGARLALGRVTKDPANPLLGEGRVPWDLAWWNTYPSVAYDASVARYKLWCVKPWGSEREHHQPLTLADREIRGVVE